jgi:hypothetical protein
VLNAVDVVSSTVSGGSVACNGSADGQNAGLAFAGTSALGPDPRQDWRYVLALVYGGKDISSGAVDCNMASRQSLVSHWSNLFQDGCGNGASVCGDSVHNGVLWHAFRPDDASAAAQVFAALIGLTPSPSASAINGFGASPYCNAMNWDTSAANANCALGDHKQWLGPGGVSDQASGDLVHRRPPPGTWGDNPDPGQHSYGADVLPTSMQDNDPIRRACLGGATNNPSRPGEEVCNLDGKLGLVLPIPASDFLTNQSPPLAQYPTNVCNTFLVGNAPTVFTCAPRGTRHSGECPNGDALLAGGCLVPVDTIRGTSQCVTQAATVTSLQNRALGNPDGRIYNIHMRDGTVAEPTIGYAQQPITARTHQDFVGGYGRIHQVETVFSQGQTPPTACQQPNATNQIGCLVQADPCSLGVAGDGARTWRVSPGTDAVRVENTYPTATTVANGQYPLSCASSGLTCSF